MKLPTSSRSSNPALVSSYRPTSSSRISPCDNSDDRLLKKRRREIVHDPAPFVEEEKLSSSGLDGSSRRQRHVVEWGAGVDGEKSCVTSPPRSSRADGDLKYIGIEADFQRDDSNWHQHQERGRVRNRHRDKPSPVVEEKPSNRSIRDSSLSHQLPGPGTSSSTKIRDRERSRNAMSSRRQPSPSSSSFKESTEKSSRSRHDDDRSHSPPSPSDYHQFRSNSGKDDDDDDGGGSRRSGSRRPTSRHKVMRELVSELPLVQLNFSPDPLTAVEGPPGPIHVPRSIAQLRIVLLVGLISSKASFSDPQTPRFILNCPVHSLTVTMLLKEFFRTTYGISRRMLLPLRPSLITTELRCLSVPIADAEAGPLDELISVEEMSDGELIVETFDFLRCDTLIRAALRATHPSASRLLWQTGAPHLTPLGYELELGAGAGVEAREGFLCRSNEKSGSSVPRPLKSARSVTRNAHLYDGLMNNHSELTTGEVLHVPTLHPPIGGYQAQAGGLHPGSNIIGPQTAVGSGPPGCGMYLHQSGLQQLGYGSASNLRRPPQTGEYRGEAVPVESSVNIEELLRAPTTKEQQILDSGAELRDLLSAPTAKRSITTRQFQSQGGSKVHEICRHGTRHECLQTSTLDYNQRKMKQRPGEPFPAVPQVCSKVHFRRIFLPHTDLSLGDCSYLDTCRHMESCRFVHYEVDLQTGTVEQRSVLIERMGAAGLVACYLSHMEVLSAIELMCIRGSDAAHNIGTVTTAQSEEKPAQWITCDVRKFDFSIFKGLIKIVMADPPWDIHMDLPYGTMTDSEMKGLRLDLVQDEGCLFLWVTGRAMELGRECMKLWGYQQIEEIVWVKTNQLHRIIRTGRTGHWLNHSKEHCLVGIKGNPKLNKNIDTDTIVAEVRETSRKPDEIYRIIERLSPGPYKLELFGRPHNVRNNWITLGNQLDNIRLHDSTLISRYNTFAENTGSPIYSPSTAPSSVADFLRIASV